MSKLIDLTGQKFGLLTVIKHAGRDSTGKTLWECQCECGKTTSATANNLKSSNTLSCGCMKNRPNRMDVTGQRFGRLTAIAIARVERSRVWWQCQCDCGAMTVVSVSHLFNGHTQSCGCYGRERSAENAKKILAYKKKEQHPRWQPDMPDEERQKSRGEEGKQWSRSVMDRDEFICVICNARSGKLNAHHLSGYVDYPELRYKLSNGVTLCEEHHREFHKNAGYKGVTVEAFFNYFNLPYPGEVEAVKLTGDLLNAVECVCRKGQATTAEKLDDLLEALWYINREIDRIRGA